MGEEFFRDYFDIEKEVRASLIKEFYAQSTITMPELKRTLDQVAKASDAAEFAKSRDNLMLFYSYRQELLG